MNLTTTANLQHYGMYSSPQIVSVNITETRIEIIKRASPNFTYSVMGPNNRPPDKIWKEVWEIENGKLVYKKDIHGEHIPAQTLAEQIKFSE